MTTIIALNMEDKAQEEIYSQVVEQVKNLLFDVRATRAT